MMSRFQVTGFTFRFMLAAAVVLPLVQAVGCSTFPNGGTGGEERIHVDFYKVSCGRFDRQPCLMTSTDADQDHAEFGQDIDGFTFTWGHRYELLVRVEERMPPVLDLPDQIYTLEEIVSDETVDAGTEFTTAVSWRLDVTGDASTGYTLWGEVEFDVASDAVAEQASELGDVSATFELQDNPTKPLVLVQVAAP